MSLVRRCLLPETRQGKSEEGKSTEETVADLDEITVPRAKGSTCGKANRAHNKTSSPIRRVTLFAWFYINGPVPGASDQIYSSTVATVDVSFPIILNPTSVINPNDMNGMTSRPRRPHTTGEPARANSIQIPARSNTVATSALTRLGLKHVEEEHDDYVIADVYAPPGRKRSQKEQDEEDEKARKRAMRNLVNSWQERLQLISVITTFFASIEAGMLVPLNTDPNAEDALPSLIKAANAGFLGALIMHVYAAVLSFLGAFLLIRYKLKEATTEEFFAEHSAKGVRIVASPEHESLHVHDIETGGAPGLDAPTYEPEGVPHASDIKNITDAQYDHPFQPQRKGSLHTEPPIFSREPHLEQVGFWSHAISSHMLSRVHALCITLAAIGFALAIMGILLYAWALQPKEVSIFATLCFGIAVLAMHGVLFLPDHQS